jgi:hypothetical protein
MNNVIIFAMVFMVFLFNIDSWLPRHNAGPQTHLISQQDMLLRMDIGKNRIERVGTDWRFQGDAEQSDSLSAAKVIENWHLASLEPVNEIPTQVQNVPVKIWLATYEHPVELILIASPKGTYVQIAEQYYQVENVDISALLF